MSNAILFISDLAIFVFGMIVGVLIGAAIYRPKFIRSLKEQGKER